MNTEIPRTEYAATIKTILEACLWPQPSNVSDNLLVGRGVNAAYNFDKNKLMTEERRNAVAFILSDLSPSYQTPAGAPFMGMVYTQSNKSWGNYSAADDLLSLACAMGLARINKSDGHVVINLKGFPDAPNTVEPEETDESKMQALAFDPATYTGLMKSPSGLLKPYKCRVLTKHEAGILISLGLGHNNLTRKQVMNGLSDDFAVAVLVKRLACMSDSPEDVWLDQIVDPSVLMFLSLIEEFDRAGHAVLWAFTLLKMAADLGHCVKIKDLCEAFPDGLPAPDYYELAWKAQKVTEADGPKSEIKSDNHLDINQELWRQYANKVQERVDALPIG